MIRNVCDAFVTSKTAAQALQKARCYDVTTILYPLIFLVKINNIKVIARARVRNTPARGGEANDYYH